MVLWLIYRHYLSPDFRGFETAFKTSLGVFKPKTISELEITQDTPDWDTRFKTELRQRRLFETRTITLEPPRKVPFKFHYHFECEDSQCKGHRMMITDWEISELYWKLVRAGNTPKDAAIGVKERFLNVLCGKDKNTHFYTGTVLTHQKNWIILGIFWPKKNEYRKKTLTTGYLPFDKSLKC